MNHSLKVSIARNCGSDGIVRCRNVSLRDRLLRRLLGDTNKLMVLIPGPSVKTVEIKEIENEGGK